MATCKTIIGHIKKNLLIKQPNKMGNRAVSIALSFRPRWQPLMIITQIAPMTLTSSRRDKRTSSVVLGKPFGKPPTVAFPPSRESVQLT